MLNQLYSPRQVAERLGVSGSSVKRWCDQGMVSTERTAGGHRRIPQQELLRLAEDLPAGRLSGSFIRTEPQDREHEDAAELSARLEDALLKEDESLCSSLIKQQRLRGQTVSWVCDQVIVPAFERVGHLWECRQIDIYEERRACHLALRLLHGISAQAVSVDSELLAFGGSLEGDQYLLPITMCDVVLRSVGWNSQLLGNSIPPDAMVNAIEKYGPVIFWLSASYVADESDFTSRFNRIADAASRNGTVFIAGGRALTQPLRTRLRNTAFCDTMQQFDSLATTLRKRLSNSPSVSPEPGTPSTVFPG